MDNNAVVSGFQFTIEDDPDYYSFVSVDPSNRVPADWSLDGSEMDGNATVLGFSFSGSQIDPGSGAIATVTVDHVDMEFISDLCLEDSVVSDPVAGAYLTFGGCSEFMNPFTMPIELTATGGPGSVTLGWTVAEDTRTRATVDLSITNYANGQLEISISN
jgi:hypothetical protein